jgi:SAM-dependent methyltransferase
MPPNRNTSTKRTSQTSSIRKHSKLQKSKVSIPPALKIWMDTTLALSKNKKLLPQQSLVDAVKSIFLHQREDVKGLWEIYTQHREELSRKLINNQKSALSYFLGFHLANEARYDELFKRSNMRHFWNKLKYDSVEVFDFGCGTGAMSASLLRHIKVSSLNLYDASGPLLDVARLYLESITSSLKLKTKLRTSRKAIEDIEPKWFIGNEKTLHIFLLGYVWNELHANQKAKRRLLESLAQHAKDGTPCLVFVAEPALEHLSRQALELREILCGIGFKSLYPCSHSESCPLMERPKDWCYSEGHWEQPDLVQWMDQKLDVDRSRHASTLFMFATDATGVKNDAKKKIVIGRPVHEKGISRYKGHYDYLLCSQNGVEKAEPQKPLQPALRGTIYNNDF